MLLKIDPPVSSQNAVKRELPSPVKLSINYSIFRFGLKCRREPSGGILNDISAAKLFCPEAKIGLPPKDGIDTLN